MKNILVIVALLILSVANSNAQSVFATKTGNISFFSETKMENIDAQSKIAEVAINIATGKIFFRVKNISFVFKSSLMQEHFNENYMESEKFVYSTFNGEVLDIKNYDLTKNATFNVIVSGKLNIHGVEKEYKTKGTITVADGKLNMKAAFKVKIEDHNIKIPSVVGANIASHVDVKVDATLSANK
jgi:hypothetical protein